MIVDVIILSDCKDQGFYDLNITCIASLLASEPTLQFNIVIVESSPAWETLGLSYPFTNVTVLQPQEPFHYNKFLNIGLKSSHHDLIVFANNDLVFHAGWLSEILKIKNHYPFFRSFCPFDRTNQFLKWDRYKKKDFHIGYRVTIEFVGWCFVIERSVFELIGSFDERFDMYFQDNDFAHTLEKHGVHHALVSASFVQHIGGYTTGIKDASVTEKYQQNKTTFFAKWGAPTFFKKLQSEIKRFLYNL